MNVVAMRRKEERQDFQPSPRLFYTVKEVQILLGVKTDKAYRIIRQLRAELVKQGYAQYPAGKVPKKYFLQRYFMDEKEAEHVLQRMSGLSCSS